jgi:hypothetical protein
MVERHLKRCEKVRLKHIYLTCFLLLLFQGNATGNNAGLWLRSKMHSELFRVGRIVQCHAGKVLLFGVIILATLTVGLKNAKTEAGLEKLWVEGKRFECGGKIRVAGFLKRNIGEIF